MGLERQVNINVKNQEGKGPTPPKVLQRIVIGITLFRALNGA